MSPLAWVAFLISGAAGACLRYLVDFAFVGGSDRSAGGFPWGTLLVNVSGSLLLGFLTGLALYNSFPATSRVVLGTGFCGAYTTFSTFSLETVRLLEAGDIRSASANVLGTFTFCAAAAACGIALARL